MASTVLQICQGNLQTVHLHLRQRSLRRGNAGHPSHKSGPVSLSPTTQWVCHDMFAALAGGLLSSHICAIATAVLLALDLCLSRTAASTNLGSRGGAVQPRQH